MTWDVRAPNFPLTIQSAQMKGQLVTTATEQMSKGSTLGWAWVRWLWWYTLAVPVTQEAEAGRLKVQPI